jgi:YhcH/YjgK/YiaL family protein
MVIDSLDNIQLYDKLNIRFNELIKFIEETDFYSYKPGKHETEINGVYFLVNEYDTKSENLNILEAHQQYLDVQVMIKGKEIIKFETFDQHQITNEYDKENDYSLFSPKEPNSIVLKSNMFAIFFPQDLHMPGYANKDISSVFKIVFKVIID